MARHLPDVWSGEWLLVAIGLILLGRWNWTSLKKKGEKSGAACCSFRKCPGQQEGQKTWMVLLQKLLVWQSLSWRTKTQESKAAESGKQSQVHVQMQAGEQYPALHALHAWRWRVPSERNQPHAGQQLKKKLGQRSWPSWLYVPCCTQPHLYIFMS